MKENVRHIYENEDEEQGEHQRQISDLKEEVHNQRN